MDDDSDVRVAAVAALRAFRGYGASLKLLWILWLHFTLFCTEFFYFDIKSSIPKIIEQLDNENRRICIQAIQILLELSEFGAYLMLKWLSSLIFCIEEFRESIHVEGTTLKCFAMLTYNDREVQALAAIALLAFSRYR